MTKSDLKTGMRVTYRNGNTAMVLKECDFFGSIANGENEVIVNFAISSWIRFEHLNNDLTCRFNKSQDIVKIEIPEHPYEVFKENGSFYTVWERKEPKLVTIAEIEKILGYPFKIVETKP
jgi:hypothetical protein